MTRPTTEHGQIVPSRTIVKVGGTRLAIGLTEEIRTEIPAIAPSPMRHSSAAPETRASRILAEIRASMARTEARQQAKRVPTGQLTLRIDPLVYLPITVRRQMRDTEHQRIESVLNKFLVQLQLIAELVRQKAEDDAKRRLAEAEAARQRAIADRLRERQKRLEDDLAHRSDSLVHLQPLVRREPNTPRAASSTNGHRVPSRSVAANCSGRRIHSATSRSTSQCWARLLVEDDRHHRGTSEWLTAFDETWRAQSAVEDESYSPAQAEGAKRRSSAHHPERQDPRDRKLPLARRTSSR